MQKALFLFDLFVHALHIVNAQQNGLQRFFRIFIVFLIPPQQGFQLVFQACFSSSL